MPSACRPYSIVPAVALADVAQLALGGKVSDVSLRAADGRARAVAVKETRLRRARTEIGEAGAFAAKSRRSNV